MAAGLTFLLGDTGSCPADGPCQHTYENLPMSYTGYALIFVGIAVSGTAFFQLKHRRKNVNNASGKLS